MKTEIIREFFGQGKQKDLSVFRFRLREDLNEFVLSNTNLDL